MNCKKSTIESGDLTRRWRANINNGMAVTKPAPNKSKSDGPVR